MRIPNQSSSYVPERYHPPPCWARRSMRLQRPGARHLPRCAGDRRRPVVRGVLRLLPWTRRDGGWNGPDLTRSELVAEDVQGDKIKPVVHNGRHRQEDAGAARERLGAHPRLSPSSTTSASRPGHSWAPGAKCRRKTCRRVTREPANVLQRPRRCATCHSPTGDWPALPIAQGSGACSSACSIPRPAPGCRHR